MDIPGPAQHSDRDHILGMIGNTLVIYIVFTLNHMRSSTNSLIANVAFANLLIIIDTPYMLKWFYVLNKWLGTFMGTVLRKLALYTDRIPCSLSVQSGGDFR